MHESRKRRGQSFDDPMRNSLPPETLKMVTDLVAQEASLNEIHRTTGVSRKKVMRLHPEYKGWGRGYSERSEAARKASRALNQIGWK